MGKSEFQVSKNAVVKSRKPVNAVRNGDVISLDRTVAEMAAKAAEGDSSRIQVIDQNTVIVWNGKDHPECQF